jgi:exopolysaccharide biosynthesis predicted pyruvyltransferase EpsI
VWLVSKGMHAADTALVKQLGDDVHAVLARALGQADACALVDFPRHRNAGDSAIWLGEVTALRALRIAVRATFDRTTYSRSSLRRTVSDHPILLHGGGNLGDLYPTHQQLRERVLTDFRGHPTVQLAQSIHFNDAANLERMRRVVAQHGALTIIVRDERSETIAREKFDAQIERCPDLAFAIGPIVRPRPARLPVLRLARIDREAAAEQAGTADEPLIAHTFDWLAPPASRRARARFAVSDRLLQLAVGGGGIRGMSILPTRAHKVAYDAYARQNVDRAARLLSYGEVVVTDRLHGHILCALLGIPHVLVDDKYGKVGSFYSSWTSALRTARFARDPREAPALADELLRASRSRAAEAVTAAPA